MNKYGVVDRRVLVEQELEQVKEKLAEKTASEEELKYLAQRQSDLEEALKDIAKDLS